MSFLFGRNKQKSPAETVRCAAELASRLDTSLSTSSNNSSFDRKKAIEELARLVAQVRLILHGDSENDPLPEQINEVSQELFRTNMLVPLCEQFVFLDFDTRKDVGLIISTLLRRPGSSNNNGRNAMASYLATRPQILRSMLKNNSNADIALSSGTILRDCIRYEPLAAVVIKLSNMWSLFEYISSGPFEMAMDAFSTLDELLTTHAKLAADFLVRNSAQFIAEMNQLLSSANYVIKRQSLKLMGTLIQTRTNYVFMTEYLSQVENLKLVMLLLRDRSRNIQHEAFDIFKVFVANPNKAPAVLEILCKNKLKILNFLNTFTSERKDDDRFREEKAYVIKQITNLPAKASHGPPSSIQPPALAHAPSSSDIQMINARAQHQQQVFSGLSSAAANFYDRPDASLSAPGVATNGTGISTLGSSDNNSMVNLSNGSTTTSRMASHAYGMGHSSKPLPPNLPPQQPPRSAYP